MLPTEILATTHSIINLERAWAILETVANTHAPGQTVACTRAPVIRSILAKEHAHSISLVPDYERTGNTMLLLGNEFPSRLVFAHADEISYLISPQGSGDDWPLVPFCKHLARITMDAVALRYSTSAAAMQISARGVIVPPVDPGVNLPHFKILSGVVQPGDRVVYDYPMRRVGSRVYGSIDNAAGVTACLLAAIALAQTCPDLPVGFAFTDEEEGPAAQNTSFSRGARRLLQRIRIPDQCIVVDGHPILDQNSFGNGALFAGYSGQAGSTVTPPALFAAFKYLAGELQQSGIRILESRGAVSRSDDIAIIEYTPHILLLGYPSNNGHFDQAPPEADLSDLVDLAKTIYWTLWKQNL